jgi:hypothetical protein
MQNIVRRDGTCGSRSQFRRRSPRQRLQRGAWSRSNTGCPLWVISVHFAVRHLVRFTPESGHGDLRAKAPARGRPFAPLEFLIYTRAQGPRISAKLAAYFWIGRIARYCHLRALAPAQIGASPSAEHRNRGVPRDRRTQHIDVGCGAHDGAAQRHPVRTTFELEGAGRDFPLGGLGLRSHA